MKLELQDNEFNEILFRLRKLDEKDYDLECARLGYDYHLATILRKYEKTGWIVDKFDYKDKCLLISEYKPKKDKPKGKKK